MSSERRRAMDGPLARAVGQAGEPKEPDEGGRNPVEANGLASCSAQPSHPSPTPQSGRLRLTANRPYDVAASRPLPSPPLRRGGSQSIGTSKERGRTPPNRYDRRLPVQRGPGRPYRPKKGSQSLNTGCNPACLTASATSPSGRASWMANCSNSSSSPSA